MKHSLQAGTGETACSDMLPAENHEAREMRRRSYRERLAKLTASEGHAFMALYGALAEARGITPEIAATMTPEKLPGPAYPLGQELAGLIAALQREEKQRDWAKHRILHACLDDWNIAVNAWRNRICLHRSAFLYAQYGKIRKTARQTDRN